MSYNMYIICINMTKMSTTHSKFVRGCSRHYIFRNRAAHSHTPTQKHYSPRHHPPPPPTGGASRQPPSHLIELCFVISGQNEDNVGAKHLEVLLRAHFVCQPTRQYIWRQEIPNSKDFKQTLRKQNCSLRLYLLASPIKSFHLTSSSGTK